MNEIPGDVTPDRRPSVAELIARCERREARVGVIGLGYVGLPLALAFAEAGFQVLGFDVDEAKVEALAAGHSYIEHLDGDRVARAVGSGRFEATNDFDRLAEPDALLICVPTPLDPRREPDLHYVEGTSEQIGRRLRRAQLVVLESTTYPGTTEELVMAKLTAGGLVCGVDFFLAFSPEREDPGRGQATSSIPKVVGGVDAASQELAVFLYGQVFDRIVPVSSARAAEASKLTENIYRAVNIALVNELKMVFDGMGIDIWEVLDAAETKPFGFKRFDPGPGWGGHCIPVDPFYLHWKAKQHGLDAQFIELAGKINRKMPEYVLGKLRGALAARGKSLSGSAVLIMGLAYKPDVADPRESPAFEIISQLVDNGAAVAYHDPHIPRAPEMRNWSDLPQLVSEPLTAETLASHDAVVLVTDHSDVDYARVLEHAPLVIDTRGVYRQIHDKVVKA